ncbi:MAG: hypothetical protein D6798_04400 [Deltaproteobacteria bacterium]|nr:MAG: hypothetical protein D6798_04400 [Deltaproteobacteria bacterium]
MAPTLVFVAGLVAACGSAIPARPADATDAESTRPGTAGSGLSLPIRAHELQDLVCEAPADSTIVWTLDGVAWTGETRDTINPGDTIPAHYLEAGQEWSCRSSGLAVVRTTVAPYHHNVVLDPVDAGPGDTARVWFRPDSGSAAGLTLRVGFDGWTDQGADTPESGATRLGETMYWQEVTLDEDGSAEITIPDGVETIRFTQADDDLDPGDTPEHLWGLSVPAMGPWLTVDPAGGLVVHFETTAQGPARVDVSWDGGSTSVTSDGSDTVHHVRLGDVPAGTDLTYTITDATGATSESWVTHRVARTARSMTVLAAADMQDDGASSQRWDEVAAAMLDVAPDADLMILPGDLAADDYPGHWWLFFAHARELFASVPLVAAVGNHDTPNRESDPDTTSFVRYFDPQGDGPSPEVGAIRYGPLRVLLLNTEVPDELAVGGSQYEWLQDKLAADTDAAHTIVAFHRPAYDVGVRFASEQYLFREVTEGFETAASLVLMGHEHIYQRFVPLVYEERTAMSGSYGTRRTDGVAYVVLPSAGNNGLFDKVIGADDPEGALRDLVVSPDLTTDRTRVGKWVGFSTIEVSPTAMDVTTWKVGTTDITEKDAFSVAR